MDLVGNDINVSLVSGLIDPPMLRSSNLVCNKGEHMTSHPWHHFSEIRWLIEIKINIITISLENHCKDI